MVPVILQVTANPITWISWFFGWIMEFIFRFVSAIGLPNIGLCIIIFTVVTKVLMHPLTVKQAKSTKLQQVVQPEIQAIQAKYKGRENDQQAMMMMQAETKAVYDKYGTSMTAGCMPLLIQFPIIFGLYSIIINMPEYVPSVAALFQHIIDVIGGESALPAINQFIQANDLTKLLTQARISGTEVTNVKDAINFLNKLSTTQWDAFIATFSSASGEIAKTVESIRHMNNFLGMELSITPSAMFAQSKDIVGKAAACIIPALAGISQWAATKLMSAQQQTNQNTQNLADNDPAKATANMMNSMNIVMPLMSVVFCFTFASGIGVYWIAQSVVSAIQQIIVNKQMSKLDMDELVKKNLEKTNAKRAKKGLPPINEKAAEDNYKRMQQRLEKAQAKRDAAVEKTNALREESDKYYKTGSIADRARMVQQFNEKNSKKK
ncbi:MAG: YidC/Oxa1 family membrane protein insertase [Eubacteriales bacterium]|nr:YidC/Oxa1 family membrane protein insertase [Eubacteriales bacterium]